MSSDLTEVVMLASAIIIHQRRPWWWIPHRMGLEDVTYALELASKSISNLQDPQRPKPKLV